MKKCLKIIISQNKTHKILSILELLKTKHLGIVGMSLWMYVVTMYFREKGKVFLSVKYVT